MATDWGEFEAVETDWSEFEPAEKTPPPPKLIDPSTVKLSPSELAKMEPGYRPMGIFGPLEPQELLELPKVAQIPGAVLEPLATAAEDMAADWYRRTGIDPSAEPGKSPITMESYPVTAGGPLGLALRQISPKTAADIDKGAADIIKGFTTPGQQLMLPAAGLSKPLGTAYGLSMIGDVPEAVKQIAEEGAVGIPRLAVDIGGGAGFIKGIPERAAAPIPQRAVVPPPVTGRALKIAKGAEPTPTPAIEPEKSNRVSREFEVAGKKFEIVAKQTDVPGLVRIVGVHRTDVPKPEGGLERTDLMNAIGPTGIKSAVNAILSEFPEATEVEFYRASKEGQRRYVRMPIGKPLPPKGAEPPSVKTYGKEGNLSENRQPIGENIETSVESTGISESGRESEIAGPVVGGSGTQPNQVGHTVPTPVSSGKEISGSKINPIHEEFVKVLQHRHDKYDLRGDRIANAEQFLRQHAADLVDLETKELHPDTVAMYRRMAREELAKQQPPPEPAKPPPVVQGKAEPSAAPEKPWSSKISYETFDEPTGEWQKSERNIVVSKSTIPGDKPWRATVFAGGEDMPVAIGHVQLDAPLITPEAISQLSEQLGRYTRRIEIAKPPLVEKGVTEPSPVPPAAPTSEVTAKEAAPTVPEPAISKTTPVGEKGQAEPTPPPAPVKEAAPAEVLKDYPELGKSAAPTQRSEFSIKSLDDYKGMGEASVSNLPEYQKFGTTREADAFLKKNISDESQWEGDQGVGRYVTGVGEERITHDVGGQAYKAPAQTISEAVFELKNGDLVAWDLNDRNMSVTLRKVDRNDPRFYVEKGKQLTIIPSPTPIPEGPGAEPIGMGGAVGSEFQAQQPMKTATKNAAVDRDRADRGLPPMMSALRKSDPELWSQAMNIINEDWQAADKLIARFRERPFIPTDVETMILLHRRVDLKNEFAKAQREFNAANAEGRPEAAESARAVRDEMSAKLLELDAMMGRGDQSAGTMAGRAFRARQLVMNEDYSLDALVREREGNLGRKLNDAEVVELEKIAKAWEEKSVALEKRTETLQKERDALDSKLIAKQAELDAAKPTASSYVINLAEKIVKDWDTRADAARARIRERMGRMSAGVDPTVLLDLSEIGLSHLGHVGLDFAKWSEKMISDVGDWAKPHLEKVWERSQKLADRDIAKRAPKQATKVKEAIVKPEPDIAQKIGENVTRKLAKNPNADLAWPARQLARHFWKAGVREPQALVDAVHEVLVKAKPELTRRETMDILSGYGSYKQLSKKEIDVALRDIRGQLQQIAKLEDLSKTPPTLLRTGFERRTPSEIERRDIKRVEEKKKEVNYQPTDPETQLRSAMQAAQRRLENQIKDLEHEIATREKIVKKRTKLQYDEKTKALQERRDALKEIHDEIFKPAPMTEAERLALWKKRTLEKIEDYKDRIASGDVMPRKRPEPPRLDSEAIRIRYELHKVHNALMDIRLKDELSKRSQAKKTIDAIANAIRFSRAVMTGGEFSGVLRQGGFIAFGRPVLAAKALGPMFKALMSEEAQFKINEEIQTRPNAPLYSRFKLDLTESGVRLSSMEEHYMFRVSERLANMWGVKHGVRFLAAFQRAYTTFLNRLRADTFDAMADVYGTDKVTGGQIANFINVATGRGSTGIGKLVGPGANAVFFAPRYSISRFQLLMGQPMWHGNAKTRAMILKQYGRALAGASVVYSLGMMAGGTVETDPRHPDFGKVKFGNTRVDPLAGLAQVTRLMATEASGSRMTGKGKVIPVRGKVPYGNPSGWDVAATFARQKLSPAVSAAASFAAGKDPVGMPFRMSDALIQTLTPITYGDVLKAMEEQGIPRGTAIGVLAIFGMGVQTYDANKKRER